MSKILLRQGLRCQEHPHRNTDQKCDRCGQPFCEECLAPSDRLADGTRKWHCARCVWLMREEQQRDALARSLSYRAARAARRTRIAVASLSAAALLITVTAAGYFVFARRFGTAARVQTIEARAAACGDLTRIRSIGAIGTQGAEDAINVFTYPQRAAVSLLPLAGGASIPASTDAGMIVDECNAGWRAGRPSVEEVQLPVTLQVDIQRDAVYIQRIALWQDPQAPRGSWVREFELLTSAAGVGEDFTSVPLDREAILRDSTEPQWFEIMRPIAGSVQQKFPDVLLLRRLRLRVLSTWAASRRAVKVDQVAVGEIAAYGPDLEIVAGDTEDGNFGLKPNVIRALAGQPKFVMFFNQSTVARHRFVSVGQQQNFDVTIEPGQVKAVQFTAGRSGRYEFVCRIPGHDFRGLTGSIQIR